MIRSALRLFAGLVLGAALVGVVWFMGWASPPEALARRAAVLEAVYPGPVGAAQVGPIPCDILRPVRLYVVCTDDCDGVWRIVSVRGLRPSTLANPGRLPHEDLATTRRRWNDLVRARGLRLDAKGARDLVVCALRIEGLEPGLVLSEGGLARVEEARGAGEEAMQELADRLGGEDTGGAIRMRSTGDGFETEMLYWDASRAERPVLRIRLRLARDGELREVRAALVPSRNGTAPATPER